MYSNEYTEQAILYALGCSVIHVLPCGGSNKTHTIDTLIMYTDQIGS